MARRSVSFLYCRSCFAEQNRRLPLRRAKKDRRFPQCRQHATPFVPAGFGLAAPAGIGPGYFTGIVLELMLNGAVPEIHHPSKLCGTIQSFALRNLSKVPKIAVRPAALLRTP